MLLLHVNGMLVYGSLTMFDWCSQCISAIEGEEMILHGFMVSPDTCTEISTANVHYPCFYSFAEWPFFKWMYLDLQDLGASSNS